MSRYKLIIEYDGTNYQGWQSQPTGNTVQDVMEMAMCTLFSEPISLVGSGRTDKGVHAYGQVAHFDANTKILPTRMARAINMYLPEDIRVKKAEKVSDDFHARFDAKRKTYLYKLYIDDIPSAINRHHAHQVYGNVDIKLMQEACKHFVGTHDFYAFSSKSDKEDTVRTLYSVDMQVDGNNIEIYITGDGFLYNMVRVIVATIIEVGKGKIKLEDIDKIFLSKDRSKSGKRLTAEGLYLVSVDY